MLKARNEAVPPIMYMYTPCKCTALVYTIHNLINTYFLSTSTCFTDINNSLVDLYGNGKATHLALPN